MWYEIFESYIQQLGYNRLDPDPCMYFRELDDESKIYLILYVDDVVIANNDKEEIWKLKQSSFHEKISMKELGGARYRLGMQIERNHEEDSLALPI